MPLKYSGKLSLITEKVALADKRTWIICFDFFILFCSFFSSFLSSKWFDLIAVTFWFKFFSLSLKCIFFTKSPISPLVDEFALFNLAVKFFDVNLLNCAVVIYLLWSGISLSTAMRAVLVAKLLILGIMFLASFILELQATVIVKLVILGIWILTSFFQH